jgi:hypothetical protein
MQAMMMENTTPHFDECAVEQIRASLPKGIDQLRLDWVLNEWSRTYLREHLSRESRATVRERYDQLSKIGTRANDLRQALEAIDQRGKSWIAQEIGREEGIPLFSVSRERVAEMKERLKEEDDFLRKLAAATARLIDELDESLGGRRPRNICAYLVMVDLAAIFEWLTGRKATREVDRDLGKDTGPFWDFAAAVWPHVFGKGRYGLSAAMKNWEKEKRHPRHGGSPFIRNMAMRHHDMGDIQP